MPAPKFETTFDRASSAYEQVRPTYPKAIFDDIFRYQPVSSGSAVLEIGMGTGLATQPFLETGCQFTGLEPGEQLARIAADKFKAYDNFSMCVQRLQDGDMPEENYDLIYAATAFHWIPEEYGYRRVCALLKRGGAFARFRYHAGSDELRPALAEEIRSLYREYTDWKEPVAFTEADAKAIAGIAEKYGFVDAAYRMYRTTKDFTADAYLSLLQTYPDHMKLPESRRNRLFEGIRQAIVKSGGRITVFYTMDLELARKPAQD